MTKPYPFHDKRPFDFAGTSIPGDATRVAGSAVTVPRAWLLNSYGQIRHPLPIIAGGSGEAVHNDVGHGTLTVEYTLPMNEYVSATVISAGLTFPGNRILLTDSLGVVSSGPVTSVTLVDDDRALSKRTIRFSWVTEEHQLADRTVYPDPWANSTEQNTVSHDRRSGLASTVMIGYARDHASKYANSDRAINGFEMGDDPKTGATISMAERFSNLLDCLQRCSTKSGIGLSFRVRRDWNQGTVFEVYQPQDREVMVSVAGGVALSTEFELLAPSATTIISGGQGELTARMFRENQDGSAIKKWQRRIEVFRDQRNEASAAQLLSDGAATLLESASARLVTVEPHTGSGLAVFRRDYDLGDTVNVAVRGLLDTTQFRLPVRRVRWSITKDGIAFAPYFSDAASVNVDNRAARTESRLTSVETQ